MGAWGPTLSGVSSSFKNHSGNVCLAHYSSQSLQQLMCGPLLSHSDTVIIFIPYDQCHTLGNVLNQEHIYKYCDSLAIYLMQVLGNPLQVKISLASIVRPNETPQGDSRLNRLGQTRHPSAINPLCYPFGLRSMTQHQVDNLLPLTIARRVQLGQTRLLEVTHDSTSWAKLSLLTLLNPFYFPLGLRLMA